MDFNNPENLRAMMDAAKNMGFTREKRGWLVFVSASAFSPDNNAVGNW